MAILWCDNGPFFLRELRSSSGGGVEMGSAATAEDTEKIKSNWWAERR